MKDWIQSNKTLLVLLLIIAVGSALRIYDLGAESVWYDEMVSIRFAGHTIPYIIKFAGQLHNSPPFYWIILHYWVELFGTGEAAVRSLSAIFGVGAILVTYLVGKELFNRKIGLIASFLSAISYFHIYYSQEARNYSLLLLLSLLSYYFFIKILKHNKNWYYVGYLLANFLLGFTHIYGLFIIASQIVYFFLIWKKYQPQRWKLIATLADTVISLLPLVNLIGAKAVNLAEQGFWIERPGLYNISETLAVYSGYGQ